MAIARSAYPAGASTTDVFGDPNSQDPMAMLRAMIGQESAALARQGQAAQAAAAAPKKSPMGRSRAAAPRPTYTARDAARALSSRRASRTPTNHAFVKYFQEPGIGGLTGQGGFRDVPEGSGAFYGGYRATSTAVDQSPHDAFRENRGGSGGGGGTDPYWKSDAQKQQEMLDALGPGSGALRRAEAARFSGRKS